MLRGFQSLKTLSIRHGLLRMTSMHKVSTNLAETSLRRVKVILRKPNQRFTSWFSTSSAMAQFVQNEQQSTVSFNLTANGVTTKVHIKASYAHKPKAVENLLKNLPGLLTDATMPMQAIKGFSTKGWDLDEQIDTIHRYVHLDEVQDVPRIKADIDAAAKTENHDPHLWSDGPRVTISCTTHVPPGLSMKDVKLAKRINQILEQYEIVEDDGGLISEADILTLRQRGREHNVEAIRMAKSNCSCG